MLTCWAGLAWLEEAGLAEVLEHQCTVDRAANKYEHHSCFLFAINAWFAP